MFSLSCNQGLLFKETSHCRDYRRDEFNQSNLPWVCTCVANVAAGTKFSVTLTLLH